MIDLALSVVISFVIGACVFFLQGCGSGEEGDEISINVGDGEPVFGDPVSETNTVDSHNDEEEDDEMKYFMYH